MKKIKKNQDSGEKRNAPLEPLIDYDTLKDYERLNNAAAVTSAIFTMKHESVLVRNSFRWKKDGEPIPEAHASMSMEQVCEQQGWRIVECYGEHLAVVAPQ